MQFILDNLSALLIASGILLSLAAVNHRTQLATIETSAFHNLKQQQLAFIELLQHDLNAVVSVSSTSVDPNTGEFQITTQPDPGSAAVRQVAYTRTSVVHANGTTYDRIARHVDGIESGTSASFVTGWSMQLLNGEGKSVGSAPDGRQIAVYLELTFPAPVERQTVGGSKWQMTFYPPLLQRETTI